MRGLRPAPWIRPRRAAVGFGLLVACLAGPAATGRAAMPMLPTISGTARAGQMLTAAPTASSYQWLRCDPMGVNCAPIAMATDQTYTVTAADYGATIEVTEVPTVGGTAVTSLPTAVVPAPPAIVAAPTIAGSPVEGQTLTEARGTWTGSPTSYAQQWVGCDAAGNGCAPIAGATAQTYVVVAGDIGHTIRVFEVALNGEGTSAPAASLATAIVTGFPPKNTAPPTISGVGQIGSTLTCSPGTWTGTQPISYAYQWLGDGNPIGGATGPSHALAPTDVALAEACAVTATSVAGQTTEKSDSILVTASTSSTCAGLAGAARLRCRAKAAYKTARTRCNAISTKTKSGRSRRAACTAKAKLTYKRALAVAKCQSIKSSKQRAACVAQAHRIKK